MTWFPFQRSQLEPDGLELRPTPRTTHLNRNAFLVGGILGAAVLVAAAVTLVQSKTAILPPADAAHTSAVATDRFWEKESDGVPSPARALGASDSPTGSSVDLPHVPNAVPVSGSRSTTVDSETERRRERLMRAREAPPLVGGFRNGSSASPVSDPLPAAGPARVPFGDPQPALLGAVSQALQGKDETLRQNNQDAKRAFLDGSGVSDQQETNTHLVRKPMSPYEVTAGMIIPAILVTQGDSDLPGLMTGRVRENVYDSATGRHLLIPQATTIIGVYDSVVTFGQERLLVSWQRLIFPDGTKLNIGGMPGTDLLGAAGLADQVDRHYTSIFGGSLLLSVMTAGLTLSQQGNNQGAGGVGQGSTRDQVKDTLATALGQNLGEVASQMLHRQMNVQPTIRIRPGSRFNVLVNKDLIFEDAYLNTFVGGGSQ